MSRWRIGNFLHLLRAGLCVTVWLIASNLAAASEYHGQVTFGGLPVPGATITATQEGKKVVVVSDQQGIYSFPDLTDGTWTIEIEMQCFSTIKQNVVIAPTVTAAKWELKLLPPDQLEAQLKAQLNAQLKAEPEAPLKDTTAVAIAGAGVATPEVRTQPGSPQTNAAPEAEQPNEAMNQRAADGLLINGSVNNGAASPFSQLAAFGNNRATRGLYNGGLGVVLGNSALDARPFSLTGQGTPKPSYNQITGVATLGGPLRIPHFLPNGPNFFVGYQWTRNNNATTPPNVMPDAAERDGDFSRALNAAGQPVAIFDPQTGLPFPGNVIPQNRISAQAQALLKFYPLPNFDGGARYNYEIPILINTHQDALQSRFNETLDRKDQIVGSFAFLSTRTGSPNVFGFLDTTDVLGINTGWNWSHRFNRLFMTPGYQFSRLRTRVTPYFENRENVSGAAGISGNNQEPTNWGPPSLAFSSGIAPLSDAQSSDNRNETNAWSYSILWNHDRHNLTFGGDFRRQEFNYLSQQDPRGTFTFTGAATQQSGNQASGSDLADFVLGIPDTSSIAYGNADKYFRESVYDAYFTDDWRLRPEFTLNVGLRWEYGAPITELFGRLVNLDITSGFAAVSPVVANNPVGPLTGQRYPSSLIRPDKHGFEPRIGIAWRPIPGSSLVVRAGYGIYDDTSVYQTIAAQMAQQAPLSKSLSVENSAACPLTLANGFNPCSSITPNTFAVDPNFRVGYAQIWQVRAQRDLPGSLQMTATYLGTKGTRGQQEFLPNTFPIGVVSPCPACPSGFVYLASNGNSTRESGQIQLRRRLHNGLAASLQYTFSKSIDDDSVLGGQGATPVTQNSAPPSQFSTTTSAASQSSSPATAAIAQNWLDLNAERGLSTFDQRHLLNFQAQYTTGMGLGGGTLLSGWKGTLYKEWTVLTQVTAGSGLPQTPVYLAAVPGTGVTGTIRPDITGAPLYSAPTGYFLNGAAFAAPPLGQWGNARRNSITGPAQFSLDASLGRTFRLRDRFNLDLRVDSTNPLNHVTYATWNTTVTSAQFGLPTAANAMRSMQVTLRLRF
jgi:trimeric autotransporter adhesin